MKYVVFSANGYLVPVIMPDHAVHALVKMQDAVVSSAGHFHIFEFHIARSNVVDVQISEKPSESLGIGPDRIRDKRLIEELLLNSGLYAFLSD